MTQYPSMSPAIVDRSMWELAQKRGIENDTAHAMPSDFISDGLIYCGCVSGYMEQMIAMYVRHGQRAIGLTPRTCQESSLKAEVLEAFVWDYIFGILTDRRNLTERLRAARDGMASAKQPKLDEVQIVDDMMAEVQVEAADIARALVETKGKTVVTNVLHSKATEMDDRYQSTCRPP